MKSTARFLVPAAPLALLCALALAPVATAKQANVNVTVAAEDVRMSIADGKGTASFKIRVTNAGDEPLSNVFVDYRDGNGLTIGDVAAAKSVLSESDSRTFDVALPGSKNHPLPVTLKFSVGGDAQELAATLVLRAE